MSRFLYLARHGETAWNREGRWQGHTDVELNEEGRLQSRALAEALRAHRLVGVHSSDLARARQTAEIVAAALDLGAVAVDAGLRERSFGCFEGLTRQECALRFPDEWQSYQGDPRRMPPGGEDQQAVVARMRGALLRAAAALPADGAAGLAVSHGGAIRALVSSLTGLVPPPLQNGAIFCLELRLDREPAYEFGAVERIA
jgi:probable phosphoglycerate mutase